MRVVGEKVNVVIPFQVSLAKSGFFVYLEYTVQSKAFYAKSEQYNVFKDYEMCFTLYLMAISDSEAFQNLRVTFGRVKKKAAEFDGSLQSHHDSDKMGQSLQGVFKWALSGLSEVKTQLDQKLKSGSIRFKKVNLVYLCLYTRSKI